MLSQDVGNPTYKRELLDPGRLDFSIASLERVDAYLDALHTEPPKDQDDLMRVVLRCGAYVGEVIRRNSPTEMHWIAFEEAAKHSAFVQSLGHSLGTAGTLWTNAENMCFPLAKVLKFIENGPEDSVYSFARVMLERSFGQHPA